MARKIIVLIMIIILTGSLVTGIVVTVSLRAEAEIAIISDLHIVSESRFPDADTYYSYANRDKMEHLSEAISKTVVDEIISNKKIKIVLIPGDMTEDGDYASQVATANILKKLTDAGKKAFVINGNHDAPSSPDRYPTKITSSQYREIYNDYGYSNALTIDTGSLSYAADINKKFRLIAIDNDDYYSTDINGYKEEMDDRLISWVEAQVIKCKEDGKTPLIMAHKPLLMHYPSLVSGLLGEGLLNSKFSELANILVSNGVNYIFTGHNHSIDIKSISAADGNILYEIGSSSIIYYPVAYRTVKITKKNVEVRVKNIDNLNMNYVSSYTTAEDYDMIKNDFRAYIVHHFKNGLVFLNRLNGDSLVDRLGISGIMAEALILIADHAIYPLLSLPLYIADADGGLSIEKIVKDNGGVMPQSDYKSLEDLSTFFIMTLLRGDENVALDSVELALLTNGLKSFFYYINHLNEDINDIFTDTPIVTVDLVKLFTDGELEVIDSNLLEFLYSLIGNKLPSYLQNLSFNDLTMVKLFLPALLETYLSGSDLELNQYLGNKEILLDLLLEELIYSQLLNDLLNDDMDRNVIINRKTQIITNID